MKSKPKPFLKRGTRIILSKESGIKGKIVGHTIQKKLVGNGQMFYLVKLFDPVTIQYRNNVRSIVIDTVVMHPDNIQSVADAKRKLKGEMARDNIWNLGQSDGSGFAIKTNAPQDRIDLTRYIIERRGQLTARKLVKRLKAKGWRAKVVQ